MADTLETLELKIAYNATGASANIASVSSAIRGMGEAIREVLPQVKSYADALKTLGKTKVNIGSTANVAGGSSSGTPSAWAQAQTDAIEDPDHAGGIASLRDALDSQDISFVSNFFKDLQKDIAKIGSAFSGLGKSAKDGLGRVASALSSVGKAASSAMHAVGKFASSAGKIATAPLKATLKGATGAVKGLKDGVKKALPQLSNFLSSLKRIAMYRILRSIIKEITSAFSEGLQNAYAFSQGIAGEGHRFAEAMDSMSTAGNTMKNQLGSAFIALLTAIAPVVNAIISLVTRLANAISQLISAFTGSTYLKAADVPKKWADAAGSAGKAAKEWRNQLLGFDEINRLEKPDDGSSGGGGGALDPSSMFEDSPIAEGIKQFVDQFKAAIQAGDWKGAGELLGNKINELLPTTEQWQTWGGKLGYGINGAIQTLYYTISTIDFSAIGQGIANFINSALEQIDFTIWGALLVRKFTAALDFLGGLLGTLDWGLIASSVVNFIIGALSEANEWLESKDWVQVGVNFFNGINQLLSGIDFATLAQTFFTFLGLAFSAIIGLLGGFFGETINGIAEYFRGKFEECGGNVIEGLFKGIKDAAVGIYEWVRANVVDPFVNAVKSLLGIHSPSTVFSDIGSNIVSGLQNGFSGAWASFDATVSNLFGGLISWCQSAHSWIQDVLDGIGLLGSSGGIGGFIGGLFGVTQRASGGFVDDGQLFIANEAGPELVGVMGGRTAVANNDMIIEGIRQGVFEAVSAAMNNGNQDVNVKVYLDSREIRTGQNRLTRAMGV